MTRSHLLAIRLNLHLLERGLRFYLKIFLRKTQGIVVPSRAILEEIRDLSPTARIADVIPTGVDPDRFRPTSQARESGRSGGSTATTSCSMSAAWLRRRTSRR